MSEEIAGDNSAIWDRVSTTAPSATRQGKLGGRDVTSINAAYMVKKATEEFGPVGKGWGYEIVEERYDDAGDIYGKDELSGTIIAVAKIHTIRLKLWAKIGGEKCEAEHFGHTKFIYASKYGFTVDDEAPKKSLTDAMKKCLSMFGFCADIFLGQFDDMHYVAEQKEREELDNADNKAEVEARQATEYRQWIEDTLRIMSEAKTANMLQGLFTAAVRKAKARSDDNAIKAFTKAKDERKAQL